MLTSITTPITTVITRQHIPRERRSNPAGYGFSDLIYGAILPAVIILQLNSVSLPSLFIASALLLAGAIRLSYFANFGKSEDGRFFGFPLSYDIPLMAALILIQPLVPAEAFLPLVNIIFIATVVAHIASVRVPSPNRIMYIAITIFAVLSSAVLMVRHLQ